MNQRIIMDVDTAWNNFKKSNQTSVEDKLDVILAQQQEILTDTSRVADLVPLVTGDKAEEDALEETGDLEGAEGTPMDEGIAEEGPMTGEESADNPFAFLDEEGNPDNAVAEEDETDTEEEFEETDEESDILPEGFEAEADWSSGTDESEEDSDIEDTEEETDTSTEGASTDESDEETDEETEDEDVESEEDTDENGEPEEEEFISFDEIEDEEEESKTKKSMDSPTTKTIKSISSKTPMTVVTKVQKPIASMSFGRASSAESISDLLFKSASGDFDVGYGVDPHEATKHDWEMYRLLKKANQF